MTTKKFDATPTAGEPINLDEISKENVQEAWKDYEAKPEYKDFNKHDLIESMQHTEEEKKWKTVVIESYNEARGESNT